MSKKSSSSARLPKEHWEKTEASPGKTSNLRYASEMGAPSEYDRRSSGLANYVKSHKEKQD